MKSSALLSDLFIFFFFLFLSRSLSLLSSQTLLGCPDLAEPSGKRQYNRDFLLGFQFMPACIQKPEGLPPISDVVLDKVGYRWPSSLVEFMVL